MVNYKHILAVGTAVLLPASVAAVPCGQLPTCDSLGFTYSAADCGTLKKLKCPFGDAYFCSGSNCKSVSVSNTEKCTKYCEEDKNVCVEKRAMTCSELLNAFDCYRYNHNSTISGTISKDICVFGTVTQATGYSSSLTFTQMTVWDAGKRFPACESEMTGRAKLDLRSASITNYATFRTDLDLDSITYSPQNSAQRWNAAFFGNTNIKVTYASSRTWSGQLNISFYGTNDTNRTENQVVIECEPAGTRWSPSTCDISIDNWNADVTYCSYLGSSINNCDDGSSDSTCYADIDITCGMDDYDENGTCNNQNDRGYCNLNW